MNSFVPYRLGIPVKIIGVPLRSHDSRRWQNAPHLSVSLAYLRDVLEYLHSQDIRVYRLAGQLAPYITHPNMPQFHRQIEECSVELAATGDLARLYNIRLTGHPAHYIQLTSPDPQRVARSVHELNTAARLFDAMGLGADSVLVIHVGGAYGDKVAGREQFVRTIELLDGPTRRRVALENGDRGFDLDDLLWLYQRTGIPIVLDTLHHRCLNPRGIPLIEALLLALATWPVDQCPKIHFSSPRTELRHLIRNGERRLQMPLPNQHSDFINPFEFIELMQMVAAKKPRPFDIMLEAKAKDLALLRLRSQIAHFAPALAEQVR